MTSSAQTALAIVGMSCRLPGADSVAAYWRLISEGRSAIGPLPADRFRRELYYHPDKGVRGKSYTDLGALASWPSCESLPPDIVSHSDPAHLSFCQVAVEAFRSAGLARDGQVLDNTGIYVGHTTGTPWNGAMAQATMIEQTASWLREIEGFQQLPQPVGDQIISGLIEQFRRKSPYPLEELTPNMASNQISLLVAKALNLNGPAMTINAACASSLIALSVAARALEQGQIDTAIVGGTSYLKSDGLILFSKAQSVSATGSRPFDEGADGLVVGEGCAALVIRRLDAALAEGNPIHAIIRGVAISSDGKGKSLWAPRREGQVKAMRRVYGANPDLSRLGYIEAHATSTQVGDATELAALSEVLGERRSNKIPIGSAKANIGHTLETAGVAGLLKAVLAIKHRQIPPAVGVKQLNRQIDWNASPFYVPTELQDWAAPRDPLTGNELPRQAAVNSFGIGGLNAHVLLDEYVPSQARTTSAIGSLPAIKWKRPSREDKTPIAVIGAAVIFPQSPDLEAFAALLKSGRDARSDVPPERWNSEIACRPDQSLPWKVGAKRGGFIHNYRYDWQKHKVSPKQVASADPLQFMLLDAVDRALHDAGLGESFSAKERTGVVVGNAFGGEFGLQLQCGLGLPLFRMSLLDRLQRNLIDDKQASAIADQFETLLLSRMPALLDETGSYSTSTLASRIAKTFNLMGGAFAVDAGNVSTEAALSASLDLLRSHQTDIMICAAGQRAMGLSTYLHLTRTGVLNHAEDTGGNDQMLPAEGVGVLLLKRLDDALRDGNSVRGVISDCRLSCDVQLRSALNAVCQDTAASISNNPSSKEIGVLETSILGRDEVQPVVVEALTDLFGPAIQQNSPVNSIAKQFGNASAASGIGILLKSLLGLNKEIDNVGSTCVSGHLSARGVPHQVACVTINASRTLATQEPKQKSDCRTLATDYAMLCLTGTPYQMGFDHGRQVSEPIRKVLRRHADLAGWPKGSPRVFEAWSQQPEAWFAPQQLEEMRGIAAGAGVAYESILAHNLRLAADISGGGCVHLVLPTRSGELLHGANEDLPLSLTMPDCLRRQTQFRTPASGLQNSTFGVVGQVSGMNGMNARGLCVSSAMLLDRSVPQQPARLHCVLVQSLLEKAEDIATALRLIQEFAPTSASAWGMWLSHGPTGESLYVEYDRHDCQSRRPTSHSDFCAANHSLLLKPNTAPKAHSLARLQRIEELVADIATNDDPVRSVQVALRDRYDRVRQRTTPFPTMNTVRRSDNQMSVVMRPAQGIATFTAGPLAADENVFHTLSHTLTTSTPETMCQRYRLQMKTAPLPSGISPNFRLQSSAWILGDNSVGRALAAKIEADGGRVTILPYHEKVDNLLLQLDSLWSQSPAGHLFLMTAFDELTPSQLEQFAWSNRMQQGVMRPFLVAQKWISLIQSATILDNATVVGGTRLGGDFGLTGEVLRVESGAITGLVKAMHVEFGQRGTTGFRGSLIDFTAMYSPDRIAQLIATEFAASRERVNVRSGHSVSEASGRRDLEVGYDAKDSRRVLCSINESLSDRFMATRDLQQPTRPSSCGCQGIPEICPSGNWVITGGARGVTAVVAQQLGQRFGVHLHLLGGTSLADFDPKWRDLSEPALRELRTEICQAAARRGEKPIAAWSRVEKALEIDANLQKLAAAGVQATYHVCDVRERESIATTLQHIRNTAGSIDGVIHGAGFERSSRFENKKRQDVETTLAVKVNGAAALMELTANDRLQAFLAFGSVSGRWGALGQTDYCMANDMLAKLVDWFRSWRKDCPATVFHWPAWAEVGMAVRPETRGLLERFQIRLMPTAEGAAFLINELCHGLPEREILIADPQSRALVAEPLEDVALAEPLVANRVELNRDKVSKQEHCDKAKPNRSALPLIDEILTPLDREQLDGQEIKVVCHLDPTRDPFLIQHQFRGRPLLPVVIAIEAMWEAASLACPAGQQVAALCDIEAVRGLPFHSERIQQATVRVVRHAEATRCELLCDFHNRAGVLMQKDVVHFRSRVEFSGRGSSESCIVPRTSEIPAAFYDVEYPAEREEVLYHGPIFRNLKEMTVQGNSGWSRLVVPTIEQLAGDRSKEGWRTSPGLLDSAMFSCGIYRWLQKDKAVAIPHQIGRITRFGDARPGEVCLQRFEYLGQIDNHEVFDFTLFAEDGTPILGVEKYAAIVVTQGKVAP